MDLGDAREEDLAFDVDRRPDDGEDADIDALDTDDEAEDQALGIDAEESDGKLPVSHCEINLTSDPSPDAHHTFILVALI
jgi:hypothetical protein